jgi:hypothetical protein
MTAAALMAPAGARLPAQQQADAADERPHRPALPQVLEEERQEVAVAVFVFSKEFVPSCT